MGSRGSGYERRRRNNGGPPPEDDWWKQQDAEKVEEEKKQAEEAKQSGSKIEHIVGPDGTGYLVDSETGEMWRDTEEQPSKKQPEPEPERKEPERREPEEENANSDPFSQERKDNALWTTDKKKVDDALRKSSGDLYPTFDKATKDAFQSYTGSGYISINSALAHDTVGDGHLKNKIDRLTTALDKAELPVDMWVQRGVHTGVARSMFGENYSVNSIQQMINDGKIISNKPFMSTSGVKGGGFASQDVILNIYAPKGTKGIYAEPFAVHGNEKYDWDGQSEQHYFSGEFEVIIQRGAQMRPLKAAEKNGKLYVDMEIVGFEY